MGSLKNEYKSFLDDIEKNIKDKEDLNYIKQRFVRFMDAVLEEMDYISSYKTEQIEALEKTFNPSDKYPGAEIEKKTMQYLYNDGGLYYFMDDETYDQMQLNEEQLGDCLKYLKENMEVTILSFKGKVFAVEPPIFVELEVIYTEPGFAGNTTTTSGKPAKLETGLELQVPMFVNIGDVLRIDTRTCEYMERV